MTVIVTKYSVGDTVWTTDTTRVEKRAPCPDCLGTHKWKATSPAGKEYDFGCPRCSQSYLSERALDLRYYECEPAPRKLTIGMVRYEDGGARYMCNETGIGSGSIWDEDSLCDTEDAAREVATHKAKADDERYKANPEWFSGNLKVNDYQLDDARLDAAKSDNRAKWRKVENFLDEVRWAEDAELRALITTAFPEYFG